MSIASDRLPVNIDFPPFLVNICNQAGHPVGGGFCVGDGKIVTCAHVVCEAMGIQDIYSQAEKTTDKIKIQLLGLPSVVTLSVHVCEWVAARTLTDCSTDPQDIAVLDASELSQSLSSGFIHIEDNVEKFSCYGSPKGDDLGRSAYGKLNRTRANGWRQIELDPLSPRIVGGFSGCPLLNDSHDVLGMVVGRSGADGLPWAIPSIHLIRAIPALYGCVKHATAEKLAMAIRDEASENKAVALLMKADKAAELAVVLASPCPTPSEKHFVYIRYGQLGVPESKTVLDVALHEEKNPLVLAGIKRGIDLLRASQHESICQTVQPRPHTSSISGAMS